MTDDRKMRKYQITLTTSPTMTEEESTRRLRSFLKMAWRSFGLRCTSAIEIKSEQCRINHLQSSEGVHRDK
jgi:hypothetical protein